MIKTAATPSIQSALLTGVANFVSSDVSTARINGSVSISELDKQVSGSTLTITYTVTQEQTAEITQVELLDADSNVLTSSTVYIPLTASTVLKHTIPVAEGVNASNG